MWRSVLCALAFTGLALPVAAQPPAPNPANVRVTGVVAVVAPQSLTIRSADGVDTVVSLSPATSVVVTRPVDPETIKPGSFVATANLDQPNGDGKSIELRIFEPGSRAGEGNRPMKPGQMMTNGTVSAANKSTAGRELDVQYPGGVRHIVVPPDVQVIGSFPAGRDAIRLGLTATAQATRGPDGVLVATRISLAQPKP